MEWSLPGVQDVVTAPCPTGRCSSGRAGAARSPRSPSGRGGWPRSSTAGARHPPRAAGARALGVRPGRRSRSCCTTAPSTSRRCSAPSGRAPCRSTSTSTTSRPRSPRLLDRVGVRAVVYHRAAGPAGWPPAMRRRSASARVLVDVDDGSGVAPLPGSASVRRRRSRTPVHGRAAGARRPTTSTSSAPAGRRVGPRPCCGARPTSSCPAMAGAEERDRRATWRPRRAGRPARGTPAPPLMHAAAQWTAFAGLHTGATVVLHDDARPFDARHDPRAAERERVSLMAIVGDAYARPLVEELRRRPYDLSSCSRSAPAARRRRGSQGRAARAAARRDRSSTATAPRRPAAWRSGASNGLTRRRAASARRRRDGARRRTGPGSSTRATTRSAGRPGGVGCRSATSVTGERTEATFPIVDGERVAVPGDRAPSPRRRHDRDARPRLDGGEQRRREDLRRGGRGRAAPAPRRRRCPRRRAPASGSARRSSRVVQLRPGGGVSPGSCASSPPAPRPLQGAAGGRAVRGDPSPRRAARPTTGGRSRPPPTP